MDFHNSNKVVYQTQHPINNTISKSLAIGFNARLAPAVVKLPGYSIAYGILRGTGEIFKQCEIDGDPYLYVDHSFFSATRSPVFRGDYSGYFRCIKNNRTAHEIDDFDDQRLQELNLDVKPWRTNGEHIVVAPLSNYVASYLGLDSEEWLKRIITGLSQLTDRDIVVKPKNDDTPLLEMLKDAWALIAYDSNAAVDAALAGIPVFVAEHAAAAPVGNLLLNDIENPQMPDRHKWLAWLSNQQFTLHEIENGTAKSIIFGA